VVTEDTIFDASSNRCRDTRRAVDAVQRCFREQLPQSFARIIARPTGISGFRPREAELLHVELSNKGVNDSTHVIGGNKIVPWVRPWPWIYDIDDVLSFRAHRLTASCLNHTIHRDKTYEYRLGDERGVSRY
jgi:hypothetical protein